MALETGTDRDSVRAVLGEADLRREHDRLWIYGWSQGHGKWLVVPWAGSPGTLPMYHTSRVLFVEFDDAGKLSSKQLLQPSGKGSDSDICTDQLLCIIESERDSANEVGWISDRNTAVFSKNVAPDAPVAEDACRLVMVSDTGTHFRLDPQLSFAYLPTPVAVVLDLSPGEHTISSPGASDASFACGAAQTVALKLGETFDAGWHLQLTSLTDVELAAALTRPRLLLPDVPTEDRTD